MRRALNPSKHSEHLAILQLFRSLLKLTLAPADYPNGTICPRVLVFLTKGSCIRHETSYLVDVGRPNGKRRILGARAVVGGDGIGLSLPGPRYYGRRPEWYCTQQFFLWPVGGKRTLQFLVSINPQGTALPYQAANGDVARWTFSGWSENTGLLTPTGFHGPNHYKPPRTSPR